MDTLLIKKIKKHITEFNLDHEPRFFMSDEHHGQATAFDEIMELVEQHEMLEGLNNEK